MEGQRNQWPIHSWLIGLELPDFPVVEEYTPIDEDVWGFPVGVRNSLPKSIQ